MVATSYTGGQNPPATAAVTLNILPNFFSKMYFLYTSPSWRKKLGFEISFYTPEIGCYFWGGSCCAWIEVLMPSLRCSCRDCGAQAKIEVTWAPQSQHEHLNLGMSTAILAWAPQSWHEHHNLGMSTAILAWAPQSQHRGSPPYAIFQHPENREI